jgi:hypothetical protein
LSCCKGMLHGVIENIVRLLFMGLPVFPTALAQGLCIKYNLLEFLNKPLDFRGRFRGKRIFGDNKTWRGVALYVSCCTLGGVIQGWLHAGGFIPDWLPLFDYRSQGPLVGLLIGLGMSLGELPNSFFKRQMNVPPGLKGRGALGVVFLVFDQIDMTLGIWVMLAFLKWPSWEIFLLSLALTFVGHMGVSAAGYMMNMRKTWV